MMSRCGNRGFLMFSFRLSMSVSMSMIISLFSPEHELSEQIADFPLESHAEGFKLLLEFTAWWAIALEQVQSQELLLLEFPIIIVSDVRDEASIGPGEMVSAWFLVIIGLNIGHLVLTKEQRDFGVTGVASIHILTFKKTRDIVSEHMQLVEPSEETFSRW